MVNRANIVELGRQPAVPLSQGCVTSFRESCREVTAEKETQQRCPCLYCIWSRWPRVWSPCGPELLCFQSGKSPVRSQLKVCCRVGGAECCEK